ncbi:MAG: hypothetical protein ACRYG2_39160 [Janthinobacterium lividum]
MVLVMPDPDDRLGLSPAALAAIVEVSKRSVDVGRIAVPPGHGAKVDWGRIAVPPSDGVKVDWARIALPPGLKAITDQAYRVASQAIQNQAYPVASQALADRVVTPDQRAQMTDLMNKMVLAASTGAAWVEQQDAPEDLSEDTLSAVAVIQPLIDDFYAPREKTQFEERAEKFLHAVWLVMLDRAIPSTTELMMVLAWIVLYVKHHLP